MFCYSVQLLPFMLKSLNCQQTDFLPKQAVVRAATSRALFALLYLNKPLTCLFLFFSLCILHDMFGTKMSGKHDSPGHYNPSLI